MQAEAPKSYGEGRFDRERLHAVIEPIVISHGAELCDIELKNENGWVLRIYVEKGGALANRLSTKEAAVDLELCSNIAKDLSPALDLSDPIPHRYHLEVGSPGVERPLRKPEDFARFIGERAKLKLRSGVGGQKVLTGKLLSFVENVISVEDGPKTSSKTFRVPFDDVVSAHLLFEFGAAPKPSGPRSHGPKSQKKKRKG